MTIAFPLPDAAILARRDSIVAALRALLPTECVIESEEERRAFETDALTAYRKMPLAVVLPRSTAEVAAAAPAPGPVRRGRRQQDHATSGEVWRRVTLEPGLEVQVSSEFRAPRGEARWDDLLRRLREVLDDTSGR